MLNDTEIIKDYNKTLKDGNDYSLRDLLKINNKTYEILEEKLEALKDLFNHYSKIGDKMNIKRLNLTSYLKFLRDANLIYFPKIKPENQQPHLTKTKVTASSLIKTHNLLKNKDDTNLTKLIETRKQTASGEEGEGKIKESDATLIFNFMTSNKNFDNSSKIKIHFDKNKGFSSDILNHNKTVHINKAEHFKQTEENILHRMNFDLFIKSFEYISRKLHPGIDLDEAFTEFIEEVIFL